ncbi:MAG: hypothetical protein MZU97_19865 [Bacillus subtilis]|nr:hypothetical protein [Bacillus subtilis]
MAAIAPHWQAPLHDTHVCEASRLSSVISISAVADRFETLARRFRQFALNEGTR